MAADESGRPELGQLIRTHRKERNLTLQQLADRAGLAVSTLSKVERGLLKPAYDKVAKIAEALGLEISNLYASNGKRFKGGEFLVARAGDTIAQENDTYTYELLFSQALGKTMLPALCTLRPLQELNAKEFVSHPGQELVFVLEGNVTIHLDGKLPAMLKVGDCAYFDSNRGHIYAASDKDGARVLLLHAPPSVSNLEEELAQGRELSLNGRE